MEAAKQPQNVTALQVQMNHYVENTLALIAISRNVPTNVSMESVMNLINADVKMDGLERLAMNAQHCPDANMEDVRIKRAKVCQIPVNVIRDGVGLYVTNQSVLKAVMKSMDIATNLVNAFVTLGGKVNLAMNVYPFGIVPIKNQMHA